MAPITDGSTPPLSTDDPAAEASAPACVMTFNVNDPTGASGISADITTIASMGAHALPVVTGVLVRDTAEVLDSYDIDPEAVVEQARVILEDTPINAWKVGFLGSAEGVSSVAEILADYSDIPLVAYLSNITWLDEERQVSYIDAFKELILPSTTVLVGNHQTLTDCLLPDWESERAPSARELAVAANALGTQYVLVTGIQLPDQFIDNVLAGPQGALAGERFERFDTSFVGAGETLSAALTAILATTEAVDAAVSEALSFLDQALDSGFRPGMGGVIPDRFFWALPPEEAGAEGSPPEDGAPSPSFDDTTPPTHPRNVH
ncbi:MAG TPA: bifunctional hydroxymethylpyrimidine kinase/phosphomethylpyrimidine kinase [Aquabacterium sp.]|nr:bifunctional hydroxymethylpyrimidine kinase/phosphomethylpyrimidine kinase [Aquabacterium sp.]